MKAQQRNQGFSLVEMMVVIAAIGIISAMAVPQIGSFTDAAELSKTKRNAQNLALVSSAAKAAGLSFADGGTVDQVIANLVKGSALATGIFEGEYFGVPGLTLKDAIAASAYLKIQSDDLQFVPDGGQPLITSLPLPSI